MSTPFNPAIVQQVTAVIDRATGLALQADSAAAAEELARLPAAVFDGEAAAFRQCMIERFGLQGNPEFNFEVQDRWVAELVQVYVRYWHQVLTKRQSLTDAETELQAAVGALMGHSFAGDDLLDTVEVEIQSELAMRGFHSLLGRTAPLLELILWRDQVVSQAEVQLPEGVHYVSVTYLNDFVLRSWGTMRLVVADPPGVGPRKMVYSPLCLCTNSLMMRSLLYASWHMRHSTTLTSKPLEASMIGNSSTVRSWPSWL
jgi:hypothetical protein